MPKNSIRPICSVANCDKPNCAKGLCSTHYQRQRDRPNGDLSDPVRRPPECIVDGCAQKVLAKGLCAKHYSRSTSRPNGDLSDPVRGPTICSVDGCGGKVRGKGLCAKHYSKFYGKKRSEAISRSDRREVHGLTQGFLKSVLHYDADADVFIWKVNRSGKKNKGCVAGMTRGGHRRIKINGVSYLFSAILHLYEHGRWPDPPSGSLTQERLKQLLHYDPETGVFRRFGWRKGDPESSVAGTLVKGYIRISVDGRKYQAARLAHLYMTGEMPSEWVDHRDLNGTNNAWSNLRPATAAENGRNREASKNNKLGLKGVFRKRNKFSASIMKDGKKHRLGCYATAEEAHEAYRSAAKKLHGDFSRN